MPVSEQLRVIRDIFEKKLSEIYCQEFFMRLMAALAIDQNWLKEQLSKIEMLSALIETSIMLSNPRRALQYMCIFEQVADQLKNRVNVAYSSNIEEKIIAANNPI